MKLTRREFLITGGLITTAILTGELIGLSQIPKRQDDFKWTSIPTNTQTPTLTPIQTDTPIPSQTPMVSYTTNPVNENMIQWRLDDNLANTTVIGEVKRRASRRKHSGCAGCCKRISSLSS